ncbi:MAG: ATP-binding protein [Mariprofundaceae bacterium]
MDRHGLMVQMGANVMPRNMGRLLLMRVVMILCQLLLVLISLFYEGIAIPLQQMMAVITLYIVVNIASLLLLQRSWGLTKRVYFAQLVTDVLFLTLLLYYSGGYTNPFISLYLLPLIIVSATLSKPYTFFIATLMLLCYTFLVFNYWPLFTMEKVGTSGFHLHLLGMWFSFALSVGLIVFFIMRMTQSIQERDMRLADMREKSERDSHVLALGAMAAGTAHELGTPLSTIAVVAHELECDYSDDDEITQHSAVIKSELDRCKQVLSQLSNSAGQLRAEGGRKLAFDLYIRETVTQWQIIRPHVNIRVTAGKNESSPQLVADITLTQALHNLLNNAADASVNAIELIYTWDTDILSIEVRDDGQGFPQYILDHCGQPEISTKGTGRGLGLFLSCAVIDRLGGELYLYNIAEGACARVTLPRNLC